MTVNANFVNNVYSSLKQETLLNILDYAFDVSRLKYAVWKEGDRDPRRFGRGNDVSQMCSPRQGGPGGSEGRQEC